MSITLYTPATGFPDLEVKIAYGLARVGVEAFGMEKVTIRDNGGFYSILINVDETEFPKLDSTFNMLCKRLLSSEFIPSNTPGIGSRSAKSINVKENESFSLEIYKSMEFLSENKSNENTCRHKHSSVGNIIGLTASTSFHNRRDGLDIQSQSMNPKDKTSPKVPRRPTNPKNICKTCALLAILGMWYASFIFNIKGKEIIALPVPEGEVSDTRLQQIFSLHHQIRKSWFNLEIPQTLIPLIFLANVPSSADILKQFDLFIAVLSRQQGYHVDGLYLMPIEKYLSFLSDNPFNIAAIDLMVEKEAFSALQELNNIIYYDKQDSIMMFARLYVQETSTNNFTNLLYPKTAKYLLKEVAMISQDIIENRALESLARTLRYFIIEKKYGYADDIRNARKESRDFEETIAKMLREGRLRLEQKEKIHLPTDEEIKEVFRLANQDFEATKTTLVILAFSFPSASQKPEEVITEEVSNA
ncbi:MAG: type I-A CRISPR-associated protein Csa5 [Candidatus Hydrothermae bacterium]|nr:type I-A CRISPR-associated protein Csa5 [Candidatus Hydrothermae bacterium]MDD3649830.1 type I-A CRISPR-associated protein Csa5 [Candidatus Hydrothermia bacterium]MDD5573188.1 type I-A CRISPR-associated protein Csa5 [Candidatus Hydrothermia bacterium]HOQ17342.1 type I-A CRISPR-associated protein Csa5 [Defluviitaleaceae bacterium]